MSSELCPSLVSKAGLYMLDERRQGHHILQGHPVHHLDVMVSDQLGGGDGGEATVVDLTSHPGVKDLGWEGVKGSSRMTKTEHKPVVPFSSFICLAYAPFRNSSRLCLAEDLSW